MICLTCCTEIVNLHPQASNQRYCLECRRKRKLEMGRGYAKAAYERNKAMRKYFCLWCGKELIFGNKRLRYRYCLEGDCKHQGKLKSQRASSRRYADKQQGRKSTGYVHDETKERLIPPMDRPRLAAEATRKRMGMTAEMFEAVWLRGKIFTLEGGWVRA
jgi:hypothetical protein